MFHSIDHKFSRGKFLVYLFNILYMPHMAIEEITGATVSKFEH
jgi:hypothetical protein